MVPQQAASAAARKYGSDAGAAVALASQASGSIRDGREDKVFAAGARCTHSIAAERTAGAGQETLSRHGADGLQTDCLRLRRLEALGKRNYIPPQREQKRSETIVTTVTRPNEHDQPRTMNRCGDVDAADAGAPCPYPRCPARQGDPNGVHRHDPAHLIARDDALDDAFETLSRAKGHGSYKTASQAIERRQHHIRDRTSCGEVIDMDIEDDNLPDEVRRLHRYLEDVEFECIQELFAQLASWSPAGEWSAWPPNDDINDVMVLIGRFDMVDTRLEAPPPKPPDVHLQVAHAAAVLSSGSVRLARVLGSSAAATQLATQSAFKAYDRIFHPMVRDELTRKAKKRFESGTPTIFLRVAYVGDMVTALTAARQLRSSSRRSSPSANQLLLRSLVPNGDGRVKMAWDAPQELHAQERRVALNESQHQAILGLEHNIELICGPPATGKSATIHALVTECLGTKAAIVTAVQNRAVEALTEKFASSATGFLTAGSRLTGKARDYTLEKQVETHSDIVAVRMTLRRCAAAVALLDAGLQRRLALIWNAKPASSSYRSLQRKTQVNWLLNAQKAKYGFQTALALSVDEQSGHISMKLSVVSCCSPQQLESLHKESLAYADEHLNPTLKVANAIVRLRYEKAHRLVVLLTQCRSSAETELRKRLTSTRELVVRGVKAVLCTSAAAGPVLREFAKDKQLKELEARVMALVVDEAGSIGDRHILPVILNCPNLAKLVLVGDTKQLPMFTHVRERGAVSLMERFESQGIKSTLLTVQYRMPALLASIVSSSFYNGLLTSAETTYEGLELPLRLTSVHGLALREPVGTSIMNESEADAARDAVFNLLQEFSGEDIVVLAPYSAQVRLIRSKLDMACAAEDKAVQILSVDASQGREWHHVVLSLVSTDAKRAGFLKDSRRQCVSLSRAMRTMTLIGHPSLLATLPPMRAFAAAAGQELQANGEGRSESGGPSKPPWKRTRTDLTTSSSSWLAEPEDGPPKQRHRFLAPSDIDDHHQYTSRIQYTKAQPPHRSQSVSGIERRYERPEGLSRRRFTTGWDMNNSMPQRQASGADSHASIKREIPSASTPSTDALDLQDLRWKLNANKRPHWHSRNHP